MNRAITCLRQQMTKGLHYNFMVGASSQSNKSLRWRNLWFQNNSRKRKSDNKSLFSHCRSNHWLLLWTMRLLKFNSYSHKLVSQSKLLFLRLKLYLWILHSPLFTIRTTKDQQISTSEARSLNLFLMFLQEQFPNSHAYSKYQPRISLSLMNNHHLFFSSTALPYHQ